MAPQPCSAVARPAGLIILALMLGACASSRVDAEWTDPAQRGTVGSLRGANVMVACEAPDVTLRNICQDRLAAQVSARGSHPVFVAPDTVLTRDRSLDQQLLPGARTENANAVLVVTLTPVATENDRPSLSLGLGGFGFGGGSFGGGGGVGVSAPVGEGRLSTGFSANGRVTAVGTGRLVWSATTAAAPSKDLNAQIDQLSVALLDSATRSGLF